MPIFKINKKLILFTHIPKCGGTSVEKYFLAIGSKMSFYDNKIYHISNEIRWNKSSPQHIDGASFQRLFSEDFFDHRFVICRNPISRLKSAFSYHKFVERNIDIEETLEEFVEKKLSDAALSMGKYDHHFKPQHTFLPIGWRFDLFRFEEGLSKVKNYIDLNTLGVAAQISIPHNMKSKKTDNKNRDEYLSQKNVNLIKEVYAEDFRLFNYFPHLP